TTTATMSALGTLSGFIGSETVTAAVNTATFADQNVGTGKTITVTYTLADGTNGGLASNYSLANSVTTGSITAAPTAVVTTPVTTTIISTPAAVATAAATTSQSVQIAQEVAISVASLQKPITATTTIAALNKDLFIKLAIDEINSVSWINAPEYRNLTLGPDLIIRRNRDDAP
ncbi:YDG domain-containing protein, partial [Polynucleobacter sp. Fuers-14]|uniref:YDG domain-containing protein n=1 Tax=Polynucleobacter sp. Fuers-14 TaxID=1758364 RepID=UPI001C0B1A1C